MTVVGQRAKYSLRANVVRCYPNNRHAATAAPCPFGAGIVAKVENQTTPKISRKQISRQPTAATLCIADARVRGRFRGKQ
jgi:hypothetical protein